MALTVGGTGVAEWAPGSLLVSVMDGAPGAVATFQVDGVGTQTATLNDAGSQSNITVIVEDMAAGSHTLTVSTPGAPGESVDYPFIVRYRQAVKPAAATPPTPSDQQVAGRWQLEDPVTQDIYVFPINPTTQDAPTGTLNVTAQKTTTGQPLTSQGVEQSIDWKMTGFVDSQAQSDAFATWARKPYRLWLTDDLGRTFVVVLTAYRPTLIKPSQANNSYYRARYDLIAELLL